MKRLIPLVLASAAGVVLAMAGPAAAGLVKLHSDPNDTRHPLDIHQVSTVRESGVTSFLVYGWENFTSDDLAGVYGSSFDVYLDTQRGRRPDRLVAIGSGHEGPSCRVWNLHGKANRAGDAGLVPGLATCEVATRSLGIEQGHGVRLFVEAMNLSLQPDPVDRAPDEGTWRGL